jgi:hypothetical protein
MQPGNESPTSTIWNNGGGVGAVSGTSSRDLEVSGGNYNGMGLRAFAGIEYFIAPKICIGTEFGWGIMYGNTGSQTTKTEYWDFINAPTTSTTREAKTSGGSRLNADTDNFNGALYFMFYF